MAISARSWPPAALLAIAFVAANSSVFLLGRSILPLAPSLTTVPGMPYGYQGPVAASPTTLDPAAALNVSFAGDVYTAQELRRGSMPLWSARQGFGAPFLAGGHPAVLYPFTLLTPLLPHTAFEFLYLLNWYLAAVFTFAYLRLIGVGGEGSLLGGAAIVASGFFQYYAGFREAVAVAAWLPALFYCVERTLQDRHWRGRHLAIAVTVYCAITGAQPESTGIALACAAAYGLVSVALRPARLATLLAFVPGVVAGGLLSAPFWWTLSDYVFRGQSGHDPGSHAAQAALGWRTLASYVMPQLYGRPQTLPPAMVPAGWAWDLCPGWIPVAVAIGALFGAGHALRTRSRPLLLILACALVFGGRIWGIAPFTAIGWLPLFDRMVFPRYAAFVVACAAAILAGAGWDVALAQTTRTWRRVGILWIVVAAALYGATGIWREPVFAAVQVRAYSALNVLWILVVPAGLVWLRSRERLSSATTATAIASAMLLQLVAFMPGYAPETYAVLTVAALGAWLLLLLLSAVAWQRPPGFAMGTAALVCASPACVLALSDARGLPRRYDATATPPPYVDALRALQATSGGRAYSIDGTPQPNFASALGIDQLNTCEAVLPRAHAQFMAHYLDPGAQPLQFYGNLGARAGSAMDAFRANRRYFNLAAVRYLVTKTTPVHPHAEDPRMRLVSVDAAAGVQIWEDADALPRAFLACPAARAASPDEALAAIAQLQDPRRQVVVEHPLGQTCSGEPSGTLEAFTARGNDVSLRFRADTPGLLVIADTYEPGWTATVDGAATDVVRVDGVFRGVVVGSGSHRVEMRYRPSHWTASLLAALAGVGVLAVATAMPRRREADR